MNTGETIALIKAFGKGGGGGSNKFIVTLTPTSPDYSGTMDKTVAEINAAYEAGQEIWLAVQANGLTLSAPCSQVTYASSYIYPSFDCDIVDITNGVMIHVFTAYSNDGTQQTYSTKVYSLTPAS